jgi:hypothetical protein
VPPGTSRLRVALSAAHDDDQLDRLLAALRDVAPTALDVLHAAGSGTRVAGREAT